MYEIKTSNMRGSVDLIKENIYFELKDIKIFIVNLEREKKKNTNQGN